MKKRWLSTILLVGAAASAYAQGPCVGFKTGVNFATFAGPDASQAKVITDFHGGVFVNWSASYNELFFIQPELLYSVQGAKFEPGNSRVRVRLHNLLLPVLAKVESEGVFLEAGPQLGYLLSSEVDPKEQAFAIPGGRFHNLQLGYVAGTGYQFVSGPSLEIRYNGSLRNVREKARMHQVVLQLQAGYLIGGRR